MKKQIAVLSLLISAMGWAQEDKPQTQKKEKEIKEVTITKTKKAVEQKADRTIFDFSEQPNLNTGTALEGIKKLPGLIVYRNGISRENAGCLYGWATAEYYQQ